MHIEISKSFVQSIVQNRSPDIVSSKGEHVPRWLGYYLGFAKLRYQPGEMRVIFYQAELNILEINSPLTKPELSAQKEYNLEHASYLETLPKPLKSTLEEHTKKLFHLQKTQDEVRRCTDL